MDKKTRTGVNGALLTKARLRAGLAMSAVAAATGCNKSSISRWERGILNPPEERINELAKLYGTRDFIETVEVFPKIDALREARNKEIVRVYGSPGMTMKQVARLFRLSSDTIKRVLAEARGKDNGKR